MSQIKATSIFDKIILYSTVSLTGAAIMIIELLGTRIIGPFYGVSLYVWSSLISVTLIALAIGYFIGGMLADKQSRFRLPHIIVFAALFTAIIPLISDAVLSVTDSLGIRAGAFCSAVILFTVPLTLLAMVGPFVITKATRQLDTVGSVSGSVYAISTCGSVIGTLLLGFYLLPIAGSRSIIAVLSILLVILAILWAFYDIKLNNRFVWMALPMGAITGFVLLFSHYTHPPDNQQEYKQIFAAESLYGWVRVIDEPEKNIRWLMSDASTIGAASLLTGNGLLQYQQTIKKLTAFNPDAKSALLIGLGSGHLAQDFDRLGIITDSIEIDPIVAQVAKKYFDFKPKGELMVGDARYQVRQLKKKYDFIIHDCFTGGTYPSHLLSQEMFQNLQQLLTPKGILAVNIVGFLKGEESAGTQAIARTLKSTFPHQKVLITNAKNNFNDITIFVSNSPLQISPEKDSKQISNWLKNHEFHFPDAAGLIITDDFNPLESMQVKKAELYRKYLVDRVGKDMLLW